MTAGVTLSIDMLWPNAMYQYDVNGHIWPGWKFLTKPWRQPWAANSPRRHQMVHMVVQIYRPSSVKIFQLAAML